MNYLIPDFAFNGFVLLLAGSGILGVLVPDLIKWLKRQRTRGVK